MRDPFFTPEPSNPEKIRSVSSGNCANTRQDSLLKLFFCQNTHFKAEKTVQYRSLLPDTCSYQSCSPIITENACQSQGNALQIDHVGESGNWPVFDNYLMDEPVLL